MLLPKRIKKISKERKIESLILDNKVDEYINWYYLNIVKGTVTDIGEYREPIEMRNLIEKMAVWYELRYPSYEINRLMPGSGQEKKYVDEEMFKKNNYIDIFFKKNDDVRFLNWQEFYNNNAFIKSLPSEEQYLLQKPVYQEIVYLEKDTNYYTLRAILRPHVHLNEKGYITEAENIKKWFKVIEDEELVKLHITAIPSIFKKYNIDLPESNEVIDAIKEYKKNEYRLEELLNCVMYRIIERGGNRIGPRRAYLFAKEFKRDLSIPIRYGIEFSDPGLRRFINTYIKDGGDPNIYCIKNYFFRASKYENLEIVYLRDIIKEDNFYTDEEHELHQQLINILNTQAEKEKVKQLKLERK